MRKPPIEKRFFFHANSVALAAHIRRREEFFVSAVASACLPATGGIAQGLGNGQSFRGMISYEAASTNVFGDFADRTAAVAFTRGNHGNNQLPTVTVAEGQITNLQISIGGRMVRVGEMTARMDVYSDRQGAPQFHSLSSSFQSVSVDGVALHVANNCDVFSKYDTKKRLLSAYKDDAAFRKEHAAQFFSPGICRRTWFGRSRVVLPEIGGIVYGTIVTGLSWRGDAPKGAVIDGNRVTIEGFGSIYLGEILIEEGFRRLTLLRFQLGSPDGGEGAAIDLQCNGTGWPPRLDSEP